MLTSPLIQPLGSYLATDEAGYVVNPCRQDLIQPPWRDLVAALTTGCEAVLGETLHSLYLRGSVPRGLAIAHVSDLDGIAVVQQALTPVQMAGIAALEQRLDRDFPFCVGTKTNVIPLSLLATPGPIWRPLLKTQALCLTGPDLRPTLPPVAPGPDLISHAPVLGQEIQRFQTEIRRYSVRQRGMEDMVRKRCGWLARRIVRSGFEIVMTREQAFTRDLYPCYRAFARYYPHQARSMAKALELAIAPSANRAGLLVYLNTFGHWLSDEIQQQLSYQQRNQWGKAE